MPTGAWAGPPARSVAERCPCPNAGEFIQAWNASSSRHRVTTSQVVRPSVGFSSSNPSNPSWSSTAPARAANLRPSSSPLSAGTVIALILTTVMTRSCQNIARVYDYDEPVDGQSYLVMELVEGPSLADVLASGPLSAGRTMDVVAQVAAGLQAAHSAGLIHRDVKPANILFAPGGAVRITDFGIAHAVGSAPVTSTGMVMGTPGYIAPERVSGAQAGPASDLYALGVVAYECLAGSQPFSGAALDVAIAHRDRPLPPLPTSVAAEVVAFVMILTAKDPAWRPGSAAEVAYQAGRLRDDLVGARAAGAPLTVLDAAQSRALVGVSSRPRASRPRYGRAVAVAALALAALTCLILISVTGFAPR